VFFLCLGRAGAKVVNPRAIPKQGKNNAAQWVHSLALVQSYLFVVLGFFMSYYQVSASYKLSSGKPSLVCVLLHSTKSYFPYLVSSCSSYLSQSRYFHTITGADYYINYLFSRYPHCGLSRPVLDASQFTLF
jgi:hypothetical protein